MHHNRLLTFFVLCAAAFFAACDEKESDLGIALQDPATLYNGITDTAYGTAVTIFDDSLLTSGQSNAMIGCYADPLFGTSEGILYTQITTANDASVEFDQNSQIDSVVFSLALANIYPDADTKSLRDLHFEIYQLTQQVMRDSAYYSFDELPASNNCFFDNTVRVAQGDSMVASMQLNDNFIALLSNHRFETSAEFEEMMKGLRIRLVVDDRPLMATANLAASATKVTVYYRYNDTIARTYIFPVSMSAHFNQFKNNYTGDLATFNTNHGDTLDGQRYLYLNPMGGTNVKVCFDSYVRQFRQQHPYAVIHYAELLLPVADIAPADRPDLIAAFKCYNDGAIASIPDMYDSYTYSGFDGKYDATRNCYRLRITQHFQKTVKSGMDLGTLLVLNGRRTSALRTVLNGYDATASGGNPVRIEFVYSE